MVTRISAEGAGLQMVSRISVSGLSIPKAKPEDFISV